MSRALFVGTLLALSACEVTAVVESYPATEVDADVSHDAASDAGIDAGPTYGCDVAFSQEGSWVTMSTAPSNDVLPQGAGGDVVPGTYVLTGLASYFGGPTGNVQARETLQVIGSASSGVFERLTEVSSNSAMFPSYTARGESSMYTEESVVMSFDLTMTCPTTSTTIDGYTATSTTLTLFDNDTQLAWTYTASD